MPIKNSYFLRVFAGLTLVAIVITLATLAGPLRIRSVYFEKESATRTAYSRLIIKTNRMLEQVRPEDISVIPKADFSVRSSGDVILVEFSEPLRFATSYTVMVRNVREKRATETTTLSYSFTTNEPTMTYLKRKSDWPDSIIELKNGAEKVVYEAESINQYLMSKETMLIHEVINKDEHELVKFVDGKKELVTLPYKKSFITSMALTSDGSLAVASIINTELAPAQRYAVVHVLDLKKSTSKTLKDINGADARGSEVYLGPDDKTVAFLSVNGDVSLANIDEPDQQPILMGKADEIMGFGFGNTLSVIEGNRSFALKLEDGSRNEINVEASLGEDVQSSRTLLLPFSNAQLAQLSTYSYADASYGAQVLLKSSGGTRRVDSTRIGDEIILRSSASLNGQFVAVERAPSKGMQFDSMPISRPSEVTTRIFDVNSQTLVTTVDGFMVEFR